MASHPPQQSIPKRQQSSSPSHSEATSSQPQRRLSIPQSTASEDSQTVFLEHPSSSESSPKPETRDQQEVPPRPKPATATSDKEPRKCWICFSDETEDSPTTSEWRSPCPCALTAHESCLLDWVADLEAPNKKYTEPRKIECPQCKAKITVARPRSPVAEVIKAIQRAAFRLTIPFGVVTVSGTVLAGCWMHGVSTIYLLFGPKEARRLLGMNFPVNSNWGFGLSFIPLTLIASRYKFADSLLPILPIFYFASHAPQRDGPLWPPSAAMAISTLPYLRAAYNEFYSRVFAPKEKAWMEAVQPRAEENDRDQARDQNAEPEQLNQDLGNGMNLEIDLQVEVIEEEEVEEPAAAQQQEAQPARNPPAEGQPPDNRQPNRNQRQNQMNQEQLHALHHHNHDAGALAGGLILDVLRPMRKVIGALLFPTISAAIGVLLKSTLPRTWTTPPSYWDRYPHGFLQSRFGRSIVGGCLFVALKDSMVLYSKYRTAQDHKLRRVVDYDRTKVPVADSGRS